MKKTLSLPYLQTPNGHRVVCSPTHDVPFICTLLPLKDPTAMATTKDNVDARSNPSQPPHDAIQPPWADTTPIPEGWKRYTIPEAQRELLRQQELQAQADREQLESEFQVQGQNSSSSSSRAPIPDSQESHKRRLQYNKIKKDSSKEALKPSSTEQSVADFIPDSQESHQRRLAAKKNISSGTEQSVAPPPAPLPFTREQRAKAARKAKKKVVKS